LTQDELKIKVINFLSAGIALKENTKVDMLVLIDYLKLDKSIIKNVKNIEVKIVLYKKFNVLPKESIDFLRYIVYEATGETLLIKNRYLINKIKESSDTNLVKLFKSYKKLYTFKELSGIFFRFKPIFLAFRKNKILKTYINKIRKDADKYHKPFVPNYLDTVTAQIKQKKLKKEELEEHLKTASIFKKIKLAYALNFRLKDSDSIVYKVRNGKGYASDFHFTQRGIAQNVLNIIIVSIVKDLAKNVKNKKIYIPKFIKYALPATEKQFIGTMPAGTCVTVKKNMVFGVQWKNVDGHRIDIDLSLINADGNKYGWDGLYRSGNNDILFSGDMTDAKDPNGAAELFYIKNQSEKNALMNANYYNYDDKIPVPMNIVIANPKSARTNHNYMIDPNDILVRTETILSNSQSTVGLLVINTIGSKFYFMETSVGNSISSRDDTYTQQTRDYLVKYYTNTIDFKKLLFLAGAKLVDAPDKCDIDLSPEVIDKTTLIELLQK